MEWHPSGVRSFVVQAGEDLVFVAKRPWEPFQLTADVRNLLDDWHELMRRWDCLTEDEPAHFAMLQHQMGQALSRLSVQAQQFGLPVDAIYEFLEFARPKTLAEINAVEDKLCRFMLRYEDTAEALWQQSQAAEEPAATVASPAGDARGEERIENWEPYYHIHRLRMKLLTAWARRAGGGSGGSDEGMTTGQLYGQYRTALFETAKYAREWGLDPRPIYDFARIDGLPKDPDFDRLYSEVAHLVLVCHTEAEARWRIRLAEKARPAGTPTTTAPSPVPPAIETATPATAPAVADGPYPPTSLAWKGKVITVEPLPWKLLDFIWKRRSAKEAEVIDAVWGRNAEVNDGSLKSAVKRAKAALDQVGCPFAVSRKNGHVVLA